MRLLLFSFFLLAMVSCRQVVDAVNMKQLAPELVAYGKEADAWYEYMPEFAPHFCLKTRYAVVYSDPQMKLGYWRLRHPLPPQRVMMEARGDSLILHRSFVWDGVSFGRTEPRELMPSLLHDALYLTGDIAVIIIFSDKALFHIFMSGKCNGVFVIYQHDSRCLGIHNVNDTLCMGIFFHILRSIRNGVGTHLILLDLSTDSHIYRSVAKRSSCARFLIAFTKLKRDIAVTSHSHLQFGCCQIACHHNSGNQQYQQHHTQNIGPNRLSSAAFFSSFCN